MYSQVLVPLDMTEDSERALYHALNLAQAFQPTVHLLHVVSREVEVEMARGGGNPQLVDMNRALGRRIVETRVDNGRRYLARLASPLESQGVRVKREVLEGPPARKIVEYALANTIDLIIMGSRGQGGLRRLMSGSVADHVIRASRLPVLVVPIE